MAQSPYPIPIFSCLDCVQPFTGEIGDFNWVEKKVNFSCPQRLLSHLPFQGSGVYSRSACEFLLHYNIIKTSHIKYVLNASSHIRSELLKDALDKIAEAWGEHVHGKRAINMCVGIMMQKQEYDVEIQKGWICCSRLPVEADNEEGEKKPEEGDRMERGGESKEI